MKNFLHFTVLVLLFPTLLSAVTVKLNDRIHFDYKNRRANDFHITGCIWSKNNKIPVLTDVMVFGAYGTGNWTVTRYVVRKDKMSKEKYYFSIHFKTNGWITFCQWIQYGISFEVDDYNVCGNLRAWWTRNGRAIRIRNIYNQDRYKRRAYAAVTGFNVDDIGVIRDNGHTLQITNNSGIDIELSSLELAQSEKEIPLEDLSLKQLGRPGEMSPEYQNLEWISVDLGEYLPGGVLAHKEVLTINLEDLDIYLKPNGFLIMRGQQSMKDGPSTIDGETDGGYFWHEHESPENIVNPDCRNSKECDELSFCKKETGDCNGIGTCTPRPVFCLDIYDPVCGCDGNTYSNSCVAANSGINVAYKGECNLQWLAELIEKIKDEPVTNPPSKIFRYTYKGSIVYYVPPYCCDFFGILYNRFGEIICHPDGGITGGGDGKCPDFHDEKTGGEVIWEDPRK